MASNLSYMFMSDDCLSLAYEMGRVFKTGGSSPWCTPPRPTNENTETYLSVDNSEC